MNAEKLVRIPTKCAEELQCSGCRKPDYIITRMPLGADGSDFARGVENVPVGKCKKGAAILLARGIVYTVDATHLKTYPLVGLDNLNLLRTLAFQGSTNPSQNITIYDRAWCERVVHDAKIDVSRRMFQEKEL